MTEQQSSLALRSGQPQRQAQLHPSPPLPPGWLDHAANGVSTEVPGPSNQCPPPAYTPPLRSRLQETLAATTLPRNPALAQRIYNMQLPVPLSAQRASLSPDPDEVPCEELSPIHLRISTRVNVARNDNFVALPYTPTEQASSIAKAIMEAFKVGTGGGIPMIDQDGRPRPVHIEVDAGITVDGANNVVGTERASLEVMRARHALQSQQIASVGDAGRSGAAGPSLPVAVGQRTSAATVDEEGPAAKRRRIEDTSRIGGIATVPSVVLTWR